MKIRCEYCNSYIDESEEKCPTCGAPNKDFKRVGNQVPTTIVELEEWYKVHNLPPYETTRFFIGIDYKEPKAFGIYKDDKTGKFVVYKNKDTGERKIRYEGKDEKYAVNELYMKLKEEILNQKEINAGKTSYVDNPAKPKSNSTGIAGLIALIVIIAFAGIMSMYNSGPERGYYNIDGHEYYYVNRNWYIYNGTNWEPTSKPYVNGNVSSYYDGYDYDDDNSSSSGHSYTDIRSSDVYDSSWESSSSSSSSSDWDSDSSWDSSDSWDSGGTDWGSDW